MVLIEDDVEHVVLLGLLDKLIMANPEKGTDEGVCLRFLGKIIEQYEVDSLAPLPFDKIEEIERELGLDESSNDAKDLAEIKEKVC